MLPRNFTCLVVLVTLMFLTPKVVFGNPTLVSVVPPNMASGVLLNAPVVFTFSETMSDALTFTRFIDAATYASIPVTTNWSGGNTVLTCTPINRWPANRMVLWTLEGQNPIGEALSESGPGMFTASSGNTGCDTNGNLLSVTIAKAFMYEQFPAMLPALNASTPYCFLGCTTIPCPRDATNVTLLFPTTIIRSLNGTGIPGHLTLPDCSYTNLATYEAMFGPGSYSFTIQAPTSNQTVAVNYPTSLTQPSAPHLTNLVAAQAINSLQAFQLGWEPMVGGSAADCIYLEIYGGAFATPGLGVSGALNGTASSVVIPAGTLLPGRTYQGALTFYHYALVTNGNSHVSLVYRASVTEFPLATTSAGTLTITNAVKWSGNSFSFEVNCASNQSLIAECRPTVGSGVWSFVGATNTTTARVRFIHPNALTNQTMFYRIRSN